MLHTSGLLKLKRKLLPRNGVTILGFHKLHAASTFRELLDLQSTPEMFEEQIRFLHRNHPIISMTDFLSWIEQGTRLPKGSVMITFDDGYQDVYSIAFPILKSFNLPACVFLTTDYIGTQRTIWTNELYSCIQRSDIQHFTYAFEGEKTDFDLTRRETPGQEVMSLIRNLKKMRTEDRETRLPEIAKQLNTQWPPDSNDEFLMLTWDQVNTMGDSGICFGSHSVTHPILSACSNERQWKEIVDSKTIIEQKTKRLCEVFAYPNGQPDDFNMITQDYLKKAGYRAAFAFSGGVARLPVNQMAVPRQPIFEIPIHSFAAGLA